MLRHRPTQLVKAAVRKASTSHQQCEEFGDGANDSPVTSAAAVVMVVLTALRHHRWLL